MAKKINQTQPRAPKPAVQKPFSLNGPFSRRVHLLIVLGIAIITWLCLKVCLGNQLGVWDDIPYIRENRLVKDISWEGIKAIFSTPSMGNYHPLTILSFAIEYSFVQLEPWLYHFDNLLLHIVVVVLVYWLVMLLSRRTLAAAITALLFALHPMHVESVAWVASRKDLLYGAFYIGACIAYIYAQRSPGSRKWFYHTLVLAFFICSLLSKGVAVTLPLALLLIDYFEGRSVGKRSLLEKAPQFLLSIIFGILAIKVQHMAGAMEMHPVHYNPIERLALGCFALITYLWKVLLPVQLHCYYSYPAKTGGSIPYLFYLCPVAVITILFIVYKYARKNKVVLFGLLFFLVNIALLLQFLPVGDAIVAERYSYIPYLGLFFIAGWYISTLFEPGGEKPYRYAVLAGAVVCIGYFGYLGSERCSVWYDETSLWRDETEKEPERAVMAFSNLGFIYSSKWAMATGPEKKICYDSAAWLLNKAILNQTDYINPWLILGEMQRSAGDYAAARNTYMKALEKNRGKKNLYFSLAILYYAQQKMDTAGYYFRAELDINKSAHAYGNYANYLEESGKTDSALVYFEKAVALTSDDYVPFMNRGNVLKKVGRWPEALQSYNQAIKINPDAGQLYYQRSFCDTQMHDIAMALRDIQKAISLGFNKVDTGYYNGLYITRHK